MSIPVATENLTFFVSSDASVSPIMKFKENRTDADVQDTDKNTGLPLWSLKAELITSQGVEAITLKIASAVAPSVSARTEYVVEGELIAVPWIQEVAGKRPKQNVSYKLYGSLKSLSSVVKDTVKLFPPKG